MDLGILNQPIFKVSKPREKMFFLTKSEWLEHSIHLFKSVSQTFLSTLSYDTKVKNNVLTLFIFEDANEK